ncbi:HET-domain-containing protein [Hypoxylon fuscum]|nr:HET-domain-containing protein [Hypoxylon fuscum]
MRLLNANTKEIREFHQGSTPPYAILSHTWGNEEVNLQELQALYTHQNKNPPRKVRSKEGYLKIKGCRTLASNHGFEWVWVDTCCIDKTSSAELSEAINSMFRWYKEAGVCYVYLADVSLSEDYHTNLSKFRESRWYKRGWTLQELVAPKEVKFYDASWNFIGTRSKLQAIIQDIAGIPAEFLTSESVHNASVAQRMSWAAKRETTRIEDMAYCLMGLFDVNMPLLYGEGDKAFRRLQLEIIQQSSDQTIFAWGFDLSLKDTEAEDDEIAVLAKSPSDFVNCGKVVPCQPLQPSQTVSFVKVKTGVLLELPLLYDKYDKLPLGALGAYGVLNCRLTDSFSKLIAIPLGPALVWSRNKHSFCKVGKFYYVERPRRRPPISVEEDIIRLPLHLVVVIEDPYLRRLALRS